MYIFFNLHLYIHKIDVWSYKKKDEVFYIDAHVSSKSFVDFCSMNIMFIPWSAPLVVNGNPSTNVEV